MWNRKELKSRGKAAFKANYWKAVVAALLLVLFVTGSAGYAGRNASNANTNSDLNVTSSDGQITVNGQTYNSVQEAITAIGEAENAKPEDIEALNEAITALQNDPEGAKVLIATLGAIVAGVALIVALIGGLFKILLVNPLEVGCRTFFVRNAEEPAALGEIGNGFHPYWRNVGAMLLRNVFIALWTMLLIVPGIIKHYAYRMVPYILADDPEISGKDAITLSRQMMDGQKWNAFMLDLSFIGWILLSCVTLGLAGVFYVNPYMAATSAELYRTLKAQQ